MAKVTLSEAAELLQLSQSTLRRRIAVLKIYPETDEAGRILVDAVDLQAQWEEREKARPRRKRKTGVLTMVIDTEEREEIDAIADYHLLSVGETSRRLLRRGMVGYYDDGKHLWNDPRQSAEDRFHAAMREYLAEAGQIDTGDIITHYALIYATSDMETGEPGFGATSGPSEDGLPLWQELGLLEAGITIIRDASSADDV